MPEYRIELTRTVTKKLDQIKSPAIYGAILKEIQALKFDPRPPGCKKLKGRDGYRIRVGDYRIIYQIKDEILIIIVLDVGHRRDIYK